MKYTKFSLPTSLGGLDINIVTDDSQLEFENSRAITSPLTKFITEQSGQYSDKTRGKQEQLTQKAKRNCRIRKAKEAEDLFRLIPDVTRRVMEYAKEKGASSWLNTLPILEYGLVLHKGAFPDALALRYSWKPKNMPKHCACGRDNNVDHALSCSNGGFPSLRHNEIRDMTAEMMLTVTSCVGVEPELQPLPGEVLTQKTANTQDGARLDVRSMGFWE